MKTETKKRNKVSLAIYIGAAIFAAYAIFALINSALYISNLVSAQQVIVSESLPDIISYFATSCGAYIFYAAALGGLGYLINYCVPGKTVIVDTDKVIPEPEVVIAETLETVTEMPVKDEPIVEAEAIVETTVTKISEESDKNDTEDETQKTEI